MMTLGRCMTRVRGGARVCVSPFPQKHFWAVLSAMTPELRCQFLRFVWGRSRLPLLRDGATWPRKFKITARSGDLLPHSHMCFFHLELPRY